MAVKWVGDIIYIRTDEGWLYLSVFIDLFSRKIVGRKASSHMRAESFFHTLKHETDRRFASRNEAKKRLFYYIEVITIVIVFTLLLIGILRRSMKIFTGKNEMSTLGHWGSTNLGVVHDAQENLQTKIDITNGKTYDKVKIQNKRG